MFSFDCLFCPAGAGSSPLTVANASKGPISATLPGAAPHPKTGCDLVRQPVSRAADATAHDRSGPGPATRWGRQGDRHARRGSRRRPIRSDRAPGRGAIGRWASRASWIGYASRRKRMGLLQQHGWITVPLLPEDHLLHHIRGWRDAAGCHADEPARVGPACSGSVWRPCAGWRGQTSYHGGCLHRR